MRERLLDVCTAFIEAGYGDKNTLQRLCSTNDAIYWQQLSEILIGHQLIEAELPIKHPKAGPDFVFENAGHRIWVEVVCPEPRDIPDEWIHHIPGTVIHLPHEALLLRWTAAIKEKSEKLLGKSGKGGYLAKGIVAAADSYVIAVNGRMLRGFGGVFPELAGISQFPYAVEATFALGPLQVMIDRNSLEATETGYQHRPLIPKANRLIVPADTFLDPKFGPISAVWAVDLDEQLLVGESRPMAVVHNPHAARPVPERILPAQSEYVAADRGGYFELETRVGRLSKDTRAQV